MKHRNLSWYCWVKLSDLVSGIYIQVDKVSIWKEIHESGDLVIETGQLIVFPRHWQYDSGGNYFSLRSNGKCQPGKTEVFTFTIFSFSWQNDIDGLNHPDNKKIVHITPVWAQLQLPSSQLCSLPAKPTHHLNQTLLKLFSAPCGQIWAYEEAQQEQKDRLRLSTSRCPSHLYWHQVLADLTWLLFLLELARPGTRLDSLDSVPPSGDGR